MNPGLFNNKYYNQLFGGKKKGTNSIPEEHVERNESNHVEEHTETPSSVGGTEDTRTRLERIFGGNPKKKGEARLAKDKSLASRKAMSNEAYAAASDKVDWNPNERVTNKSGETFTGVFTFRKNGAKAIRLESGRFKIVQGASSATMDRIRGQRAPGGKNRPIKKAAAQRAFSSYFNRKMKQAKAENAENPPKSMRSSKVAAVKRAKEYALSTYKKNTLNETSPKGYLYLRKEKEISRVDGDGNRVTRRAGPAIYSFEGVAPVERKDKDGNVIPVKRRAQPKYKDAASKAKVEQARQNFGERMAQYRQSVGYKRGASPKKSRTPRRASFDGIGSV